MCMIAWEFENLHVELWILKKNNEDNNLRNFELEKPKTGWPIFNLANKQGKSQICICCKRERKEHNENKLIWITGKVNGMHLTNAPHIFGS